MGTPLANAQKTFSRVWLPELSYFAVFAPMAIILVLRPSGLFGRSTA